MGPRQCPRPQRWMVVRASLSLPRCRNSTRKRCRRQQNKFFSGSGCAAAPLYTRVRRPDLRLDSQDCPVRVRVRRATRSARGGAARDAGRTRAPVRALRRGPMARDAVAPVGDEVRHRAHAIFGWLAAHGTDLTSTRRAHWRARSARTGARQHTLSASQTDREPTRPAAAVCPLLQYSPASGSSSPARG